MAVNSPLLNELKRGYGLLFEKQWPPLLGGVLIGLLAILIEAWSRPWGIVAGIRNWADWLFYGVGLYAKKPDNPFFFSPSVMDLGFILGALAAALLAKEFAFRRPPKLEAYKGLFGGLFMGVGSSLALGCNVGAFYSPLANLSASGFLMMIGLIGGAYLGLRYILWEVENLPSPSPAPVAAPPKPAPSFNWKTTQPYLGALVLVGLVAAAHVYGKSSYAEVGGLLLFGAAFGVVIQRCRFCFVRAFRDPFMTGEAEIGKAVVIGLIIAVIGIAVLKGSGLRRETMYVIPAFGWGSLVGGVIFGIGMVVAGGCGSGTLWRVAEGNLKLWIALFAFAASNSLMTGWLDSSGIRDTLGAAVFLPRYLGWEGAILLIIGVALIWYLVLAWNEETNKFTVGL
ncbi:MAG: YeeE/YedE thiosulfate transporter family protein [Desulfobaccales bacterium]